ncbi:alpha/beta-hydrolase [Obba rivulosa]|uniref:Alpha/beta-hydrolase n=1 Tax=Obba rivulosa TaxID=1052685 RepID=A0A8E2AUL6_9APHY|nr:alpha/beta-hydrolase [Obba rivulosa]
MRGLTPLLTCFYIITTSLAASISSLNAPLAFLDNGTFVGKHNGSADCYLGIPYAEPPARYRQAEPNHPYTGVHDATQFGFSCPGIQDSSSGSPYMTPLFNVLEAKFPGIENSTNPMNEDCLTANIWTPKGAGPGDSHPVVVFLYLGAFVYGGSSSYNGGFIVERSVQIGKPIVYVSINYRVAAFGFLPGEESRNAGVTNLGMRDQRQALRWIKRYIQNFGGDPNRVTIWGINAGAESVGCQMLANNGDTEGLFTGAVMQSGFPLPMNTYAQLQSSYDTLVNATNCTGHSDTLDCLRHVPYDDFYQAMLLVPTEDRLSGWQAIVDYDFIQGQPPSRMKAGLIARIPYIVADTDDEGTETAFFLPNITTDEEVADYVQQLALPGISDEQTAQVLELYPSDPAKGSPFGTGDANQVTPQFKRLSALIGDIEFHGWRRYFLNTTSDFQHGYSYVSKFYKDLEGVGSGTASDLPFLYGRGPLTDYLINFVREGTPNNGTAVYWPRWTKSSPQILSIANDSQPVEILEDTFRKEAIDLVVSLNLQHPE